MSKKNTKQSLRVIAVITLIGAAALSAFLALPLTAIGDPPPGPPVISDDQMQTPTTTVGGAQVLQTTRTVPHWSGSTLDPSTGVTYGYNMVGANPNTCSGTDCDVTVTVDIIPLNVTVADEAFNGTEVVAATVASPVFALNDYGSTPFASATTFQTRRVSSRVRAESFRRTTQAINSSSRTLRCARISTRPVRALTICG